MTRIALPYAVALSLSWLIAPLASGQTLYSDYASFASATSAPLLEDFGGEVVNPAFSPYITSNGVTLTTSITTTFFPNMQISAPDALGMLYASPVLSGKAHTFRFNIDDGGSYSSTIDLGMNATAVGIRMGDLWDGTTISHLKILDLNGTVIFEHDEAVSGARATNVSEFWGIDLAPGTTTSGLQLEFTTDRNDNHFIDQIYALAPAPPVPEPSSTLLVLTAFAATALRRRK